MLLITVSLFLLLSRTNGCKIKELGAQLEGGRGRGIPCPFLKREKKYPDFLKSSVLILEKKLPVCVYLWLSNSHLKCSFKSILDKKYLFYTTGSFYCNMKLIKLCLLKETSPARKNSWFGACLYKVLITFTTFGALITFAAFAKFISTKVSPCMHFSVFFICTYI